MNAAKTGEVIERLLVVVSGVVRRSRVL